MTASLPRDREMRENPRQRLLFFRGLSRLLAGLAVSAVLLAPNTGRAGDVRSYTFDTYVNWLQKYQNAKPDFKPGDVLTSRDLERMRPFMPPGFIEDLDFPEFQAPIIAARSNRPRQDYVNCTEKYQSQVKLLPNGALANYVCGQPIADSDINTSDPTSGLKAAWNFNFRWQHYGITKCAPVITWARFPGTHAGYAPNYENPPQDWVAGVGGWTFEHPGMDEMASIYGGGGSLERTLQLFYSRLYYTHLAALSDKGGVLPIEEAPNFEYKEFDGFFSPFDIRGTAFVTYRYADAGRADDAWAYLPTLRRVRRISVEVKSDSLLGTDHTLEDFYGFAGRPLEWDWRFLGWKDVLTVMDSKYDFQRTYGPKGIVPNDQWQLRRFAVVQRIPKDPRHTYGSVINLWDAENWDSFYEVAFDRHGRLWKLWFYPKRWSEDFQHPYYAQINHGTQLTNFQGVQVEDVQNNHATIWPCYCGYPAPDLKVLPAFLSASKLEEIHR